MKLKLVAIAIVAIAALYFLNRYYSSRKEYIPGVPAAAGTPTGEVRERLTVGFLPVT